jgi:hypothetical protein
MRDVSLPSGARSPRRPGDQPPSPIQGCVVLLVLMAMVGCACTPGFTTLETPEVIPTLILWGCNWAWFILCAITLGEGLEHANPRSWAGVVTVFGARGTGAIASTVLLLFPNLPAGWANLALGPFGIYLALTTLHLFRRRDWFQIGERDGWKTLWARGRWYLVITLALEFWLAWSRRPR